MFENGIAGCCNGGYTPYTDCEGVGGVVCNHQHSVSCTCVTLALVKSSSVTSRN
jgi:hypothetical protein